MGNLEERRSGLSNRLSYEYLLNTNTINRPRLMSLSPVNTQKKLTILEAPAGFGKSVLMAQWAEDAGFRGMTVSWYRLTEEDNTRANLFSNLYNLLKDELPSGTGMRKTDDSLAQFRELSGRLSRKHIIFLHNLERLGDPDVIAALTALIDYSGLSVFFVFAGNAGHMIPVSSYRAHNQLTYLSAEHLAFSGAEVSALFAGRLAEGEPELLLQRSGGWPVALWYERCRLEAAGGDKKLPFEDDTNQLSPDLEEFIEEQILTAIEPALLEVLVELSIFRQVTIKQARFVCDRQDVEGLLMNHQLSPLVYTPDDLPGVFRFNALFRKLLHKKLLGRDAGSLLQLHQLATEWYVGQNAPFDALRHAAEAEDVARMLELFISFGGVEIGLREGIGALDEVVSMFPLEVAENEPHLLLSRVLIYMKDGKFAIARSLLERAIQRIAFRSEDHSLEYYQSIVVMLLAAYEDKPVSRAEIEKYEEQSKQEMPGRFWSQGWFNNLLCMMYYAIGDMGKAREAATISLEFYSLANAAYSQVFMHVHLALINNITGDLKQSREQLERARTICAAHFTSDTGLSAIVKVLQAEVEYEQGQEEPARRLISGSLGKIEAHEGWAEVFVRGYITASALEYAAGAQEPAFAFLERGRNMAGFRNLPRLERIMEIQKLDLLTLSGNLAEAQEVIEELSLGKYLEAPEMPEDMSFQEAYRTVFALSRYCIRRGQEETALQLLGSVMDIQKQKKHFSFYVKSAILHILALDGLERHSAADELFRELAGQPRTHGYVRSFISEGKAFRNFVRGHVKRITLAELPVKVVSFIGILMADQEQSSDRADPANVLTRKELEVLRNLSSGQSNKVIANAMNLSETTVKFHMRNIFSKLGVQNRMIAVEVARAKNIL